MKTYPIHLLVGQRVCSYPGEYGPEIIASADYFTMDLSPDYLDEEEDKARQTHQFSALARMEVEIPFEAVEQALNPAKIKGKVKPSQVDPKLIDAVAKPIKPKRKDS
jgi:hypothetical protein